MSKYIDLSDGIEAKISNGKAYIRVTNMINGCVEQGGYINRIYRAKTNCKTVDELAKPYNIYGISEIDVILDDESTIIRYGDKIY
jgi:hypothetical protein